MSALFDRGPRRKAPLAHALQREDHAAVDDGAQDVVVDRFCVPRSVEPDVLPEPPGSFTFGRLVRLGGAIAAAAVVALLVVSKLPGRNAATPNADEALGTTATEPVAGQAPSAISNGPTRRHGRHHLSRRLQLSGLLPACFPTKWWQKITRRSFVNSCNDTGEIHCAACLWLQATPPCAIASVNLGNVG
jgi:hypothetical protein